jgi:hypothetical protein
MHPVGRLLLEAAILIAALIQGSREAPAALTTSL